MIVKLLFKNPLRHKLRTALTVTGITIAILAFGLLRTVVDAWYAGVEASSASRLVTRNAISIIFPLPISYKDKIRQVDGVAVVSWGNWFGGIYKDEKNIIPNFSVDPESYLKLYPEYVLPPEQEKAFIGDRKGAIAGRKTAQRQGWKIGDGITLKGTIYPGTWDFVIRGIYSGRYKSTDESQLLFHWDYVNETLRKTAPRRVGQAGFYMIGVDDPDRSPEVAVKIDSMFKNSLAETLTESEKAFQLSFISMTEAIVIAIRLVSFVVIVIIMVVAANTMAMTARERIGEYAVFKTLGFGGRHLAFLIFGESLLISMTGCALGIALTFPAARAFAQEMGTYFPVFNIARDTLYMDALAALAVGVVAGIFPAWRATRIRIADGLRRIG
ncbi:MAG TPA: FtsX-like permease family protein [Nitrospirota bacterium]|nr:FtsX-like permease family protein [Nitrospirota bacterium]